MGKRKFTVLSEKELEENEQYQKFTTHSSYKNAGEDEQKLYVVLDRANLEVIKIRDQYELINTDHHGNYIRKHGKDEKNCRPDILHQCLLMLQDSPLNKAGKLQVFIHSEKNVLIKVSPNCSIPRTYLQFCKLMVTLLQKLAVRGGGSKLMQVIKNPVSDHIPAQCRKVSATFGGKLVRATELVPSEGKPLAIVIGAMAHGQTSVDGFEEGYAISAHHLSGAAACDRVCGAFERAWGVL